MALKTTRWSPDTCECVLEYSWDPDVSEDNRSHSFTNLVKQCPIHDGINTPQEVHDTVRDENETKNLIVAKLIEQVPRLKKAGGLDDSVEYNFEFTGRDKARQLRVSFANAALTKAEKLKLAAAVLSLKKTITLD